VQVHEKEREVARAWERKNGRAPTSRQLLHIANQQGVRHALNAPSVVVWDTGEWVEHGSEGPAEIKDYWARRVSGTGFHPCGPGDAPRGLPPQWAAESI